ncbi:Calx-beta domain-containing protein [Aerosakkonemataceae cyanobacterium BLCC-F154]|uniref:Calx-beta domain-containing protein n=1 Tax=Floridaenema fluviatile BLCC-F154 TaxID=3153640 RepID=A0ABV4Y9Z6_9CYAN
MDTISFTQETFEVSENGSTTFPVTVIRSGDGIGAVTAQIKLASSTKTGRATLGKDYTNSTVTVTWTDGEIGDKIVDVAIIDDGIAEPIERVNLSFGEIRGATKGAIKTSVVAIQDSLSLIPDSATPDSATPDSINPTPSNPDSIPDSTNPTPSNPDATTPELHQIIDFIQSDYLNVARRLPVSCAVPGVFLRH